MIDDLITRLSSEVSELAGRTFGAAEFVELTRRNGVSQHGTSAYVVPLGIVGREADAAAGAFTQSLDEAFAVFVAVRNHTPADKAVLDDIRGFKMRVIRAIAGWGPDDEVGVFRLARDGLVSAVNGTLIYQIDFSITDQLRILS